MPAKCSVRSSRPVVPLLLLFLWLFYYPTVNAQGSYYSHEVNLDESKHDEEFFTFITRPDLVAPRWNINVYDKSSVSPGYWFTSPYRKVKQTEPGADWTAPYIYDSDGELIWSGALLFERFGTFDFRVVSINGTPMLSLISYHEAKLYILDETYNVHKKIDISAKLINIHEFATVDDGTRALHMVRDEAYASRAESRRIGFNGRCFVDFEGFREMDTTTWEPVFSWSSVDHISLNESYALEEPVKDLCADPEKVPWEFLHLNSVDKFPDGDYLVSGRRTFTLYKISHIDGSIVWRLGGKLSDFKLDDEFLGQHAARVHEQNETHAIISLFDNAWFKDYIEPTYKNSRGVLLALHTNRNPMRAETLMTFDHPEGEYVKARGNMEILPNGHAWICWAKSSLHSEHGPDGALIMKAEFRASIDSYRSFKFPWVGRPSEPPEVHASAIAEGDEIRTLVHVSWNGATEVARWKLWHTDLGGQLLELVAATPRQGFETVMKTKEFAGYVLAEALDRDGVTIGKSNVIQTILPHNQSGTAVKAEAEWQVEHHQTHPWLGEFFQDPIVAFLCGIVLSAVVLALVWTLSRLNWSPHRAWWDRDEKIYEPLSQETDGHANGG